MSCPTIQGRTARTALPREPDSYRRAGDLTRPEGHHSCGTAPGSHRTSLLRRLRNRTPIRRPRPNGARSVDTRPVLDVAGVGPRRLRRRVHAAARMEPETGFEPVTCCLQDGYGQDVDLLLCSELAGQWLDRLLVSVADVLQCRRVSCTPTARTPLDVAVAEHAPSPVRSSAALNANPSMRTRSTNPTSASTIFRVGSRCTVWTDARSLRHLD